MCSFCVFMFPRVCMYVHRHMYVHNRGWNFSRAICFVLQWSQSSTQAYQAELAGQIVSGKPLVSAHLELQMGLYSWLSQVASGDEEFTAGLAPQPSLFTSRNDSQIKPPFQPLILQHHSQSCVLGPLFLSSTLNFPFYLFTFGLVWSLCFYKSSSFLKFLIRWSFSSEVASWDCLVSIPHDCGIYSSMNRSASWPLCHVTVSQDLSKPSISTTRK
jgi:hypothetical protein